MINDPIVEEIHRIREKLSRKFQFDVRKIFDDVKQKERQHGNRLVNLRLKSKRTGRTGNGAKALIKNGAR